MISDFQEALEVLEAALRGHGTSRLAYLVHTCEDLWTDWQLAPWQRRAALAGGQELRLQGRDWQLGQVLQIVHRYLEGVISDTFVLYFVKLLLTWLSRWNVQHLMGRQFLTMDPALSLQRRVHCWMRLDRLEALCCGFPGRRLRGQRSCLPCQCGFAWVRSGGPLRPASFRLARPGGNAWVCKGPQACFRNSSLVLLVLFLLMVILFVLIWCKC